MKNGIWICLVWLYVCMQVWSVELVPVRVTADRVNLRAGPGLQAETVGQVNYDDQLQAIEIGTNWVQVVPPEGIDFWVHRDFIVNGQVNARELNVRSGPGINFKVTGQLKRSDRVDVRGEFGEWIKIAPPPDASVWITREFVEPARPGNREAMGEEDPHSAYVYAPPAQPLPAVSENQVILRPKPVPAQGIQQRPKPQIKRTIPLPSDWELIPLEGQGKTVEVEGVLRKIGFMIKRPTRFRLVQTENSGDMVCYIRGNEAQLTDFLGREMLVTGREYWVQGYRYPIVVVERVRLLQ